LHGQNLRIAVRSFADLSRVPPVQNSGSGLAPTDTVVVPVASNRPALFLFGEAGIGKSTALKAAAERHGEPVFRVACQRIAQKIALDPLLALHRAVTKCSKPLSPSERDLILELQFALEHSTVTLDPLVQIDDLHWADDETLNAIPYLVDRLQDFPVRWQVAARTGYEGIEAMYDRLHREQLADAVTLRGLSADAIGAIVDAEGCPLPPQQRAAVVEQSKGNPLYAQLLTRASSPGILNVNHAARDHVADLSTQALTVGAALAIFEEPLSQTVLAEMTAIAPSALLDALRLLIHRGLVEVRENRFAVRHQLLGDAIVDEAPPLLRRRLHAAAARIVTDDEKRARYLLTAKEIDLARSTFARLGWDALYDEEWEKAARCFAEVIALRPPPDAPPLERSESVAEALHLARRVAANEPSHSIASEGAERWHRLAPPARARLELARLKAPLFESPTFDGAERKRIASLIVATVEPAIAAEICYQCIRAARHQLDDDAVHALIQQLRALVPSLARAAPRMKALARCAMCTALYDNWTRGIAEFEDAIRWGAAAHAYDAILEVVLPVMNTMIGLGKFEEAIGFGQFAHELPGGSLRSKLLLAPNYALALHAVGRPKEALAVMRIAAIAIPSLGLREREIFVAQQITLESHLGLVESARALIAQFTGTKEAGTIMQLSIGHFNEQHGDLEVARCALEADLESPLRAHPANLRYALLALARIAISTGNSALMQRTLRRLERLRGTGAVNDACVAWGDAYRSRMDGNADAALFHLQQARSASLPVIESARIALETAQLTRQSEDFARALELFRSIDCTYMAERTTTLANSLGISLSSRSAKPKKSSILTERERTIALMIAAGKTNAEIAIGLSISRRTVEHHVDHIRRKLEVRSRVEVAVAVANGVAS
jgi:DNA-binding CsgD family transcriptional regulator